MEDPGQPDAQQLEQQARDMGEKIRTRWNKLAEERGYDQIPDREVLDVGASAAAVAQKYGLTAAIMRWPELALLLALAPYLWSAFRKEARRRSEQRDRRNQRGAVESTQEKRVGPGSRQPPQPAAAAPGIPRYEGTSLSDVEPHA